MIKTGISTACYFGQKVVEDAVDDIAKMGVKDIEVFLNTYCEYTPEYVRELKDRIDGYGMKVHSMHPHGVQFEPQLFSAYDRTVEDCTKIFKSVLLAAKGLGADNYIFHGGLFFKPAIKNRVNFERVGKTVSRLADMAADFGIRLAYENVHWCWFSWPEFATKLLKYVESDNLYFNFDIKQAAQSGHDPLEYVDTMASRLASIHVCDYKHIDQYFMPCSPFEGDMDFAALREKLQNIGYNGPMMLELYSNNYRDSEDLKGIYDRLTAFMHQKDQTV